MQTPKCRCGVADDNAGTVTGKDSNVVASSTGWSLWDSGEWWMLLAAQSMAVGTVLVPWVTRFVDPVMATGYHMILGGMPLLALSVAKEGPVLADHLPQLTGTAHTYQHVFKPVWKDNGMWSGSNSLAA